MLQKFEGYQPSEIIFSAGTHSEKWNRTLLLWHQKAII